jgi:hypothetical protein
MIMLPSLLTQQTADKSESTRDIECRVQSPYGVLGASLSERDRAEKGRRLVLQRFVFTPYARPPGYPTLWKLNGVGSPCNFYSGKGQANGVRGPGFSIFGGAVAVTLWLCISSRIPWKLASFNPAHDETR